jgi:uncharacterized protein
MPPPPASSWKYCAARPRPSSNPPWELLEGALALTQNNPAAALQQLATVDSTRLTRGGEIYYLQLQANALEQLQQQPLEAAKVLIERQELLSGDEREANSEHIHRIFCSPSRPQSLRQAQGPGNTDLANGWFRLMAILNSDNLQPGATPMAAAILAHRLPGPSRPGLCGRHPGGARSSPAAYQPAHIAVLLPLSGRLAEQADAIRNGILSAHQGQDIAAQLLRHQRPCHE